MFITRGATTGAWATTFTGGRAIAGAGAERAICCCCWIGSGRPGVRASALCRCWNDEGGGAGAVLATTGRLMTAAEGRGVLATGAAGRPSTLATWGLTGGAAAAGRIAVSWAGDTRVATCCTGRALAKAFCGTATTAPGTARLA